MKKLSSFFRRSISFIFGILVFAGLPDIQDKLGEAVDIDDGKIDRINEGKIIGIVLPLVGVVCAGLSGHFVGKRKKTI